MLLPGVATDLLSPDDLIASVVALALSIRVIGGSIGFTIYYNVFVQKLTPLLPEYVSRYALNAGLPESSLTDFVTAYFTDPTTLSSVAGVNADVIAAAALGSSWAYSEALKWVWYISIPFGVCAIITSFFVGDVSKYMTNRIAAHIAKK